MSSNRVFGMGLLALLLASHAHAASSIITTIAGDGHSGHAGDGGAATSAELLFPIGAAQAPDSGIPIADEANSMVRELRPDGSIETVAGAAGAGAYGGDVGTATSAQFNAPFVVSVTPDGEVLAADRLGHRILRIDASLDGPPTVRVQNHRLVNGSGNAVQLRGANRAVFESRCTYDNDGIADGPIGQPAVQAMLAWDITTVRVTLNEDCWLGINGLPLDGDAAGYRAVAVNYVNLLRGNNLYVILVPQSSAPGADRSTMIDYMPDASHLPAFWRSVAATFKTDHGIVFDPIDEVAMASWNNPDPVPPGQWNCWLNGCVLDSVYGGRFTAAGLQSLVDAIRSEGATQPILLGGLDYNADFSQLLSFLPSDPQGQLVASAHVYDFSEGSGIDAMFIGQLEPIAQQMPVIIGELGERNCDSGTASYTSHVLSLIDGEVAKGNLFGVLGWTWNAKTSVSTGWQCPTGPDGQGGPLLIRYYSGDPTVMGAVLRTWLESKAGSP